jgi:hypothetical protein
MTLPPAKRQAQRNAQIGGELRVGQRVALQFCVCTDPSHLGD